MSLQPDQSDKLRELRDHVDKIIRGQCHSLERLKDIGERLAILREQLARACHDEVESDKER